MSYILRRAFGWQSRTEERLLWHGPRSLGNLEQILASTFRPYFSSGPSSVNAYGRGTYFTR
jgi:hypothetical protein